MKNIERDTILNTAKEVLQTEAEAILHISERLNGEFVSAVEAILACKGKVILTGMGKSGIIAKRLRQHSPAREHQASFSIQAKHFTVTSE